jgi:hypothetical protein
MPLLNWNRVVQTKESREERRKDGRVVREQDEGLNHDLERR